MYILHCVSSVLEILTLTSAVVNLDRKTTSMRAEGSATCYSRKQLKYSGCVVCFVWSMLIQAKQKASSMF